MNRTAMRLRAGIILVAIICVIMGAGNVFGDEQFIEPRTPPPNPMNVTADALILRPVGLVMVPVMGLVYAISYPFAKTPGNEQETFFNDTATTEIYTFHRPMGRGAPFE